MAIGAIALALAVSGAGAGATPTPLFELVPVPPEYAAVPTPIPTPSAKARAKARARAAAARARRRAVPPPPAVIYVPSVVPVPVMAPPPPPQMAVYPPPPPMPPRGPNSKVSARNPGSWVTNDDYPAAAIRENMQGTVRFSLDVDEYGRPTGCSVVKSSGWPILDDTTCALLRRRARFLPATDENGVAIAGNYTNRFRWEMPFERESPMASWARVTRFAVNPEGDIMGCFTSEYGAPPAMDARPCDAGMQPDAEAVSEMLGSATGAHSLELVETHIPEGAQPPAGFAMPPGATVAVRDVRLTIAEEGFVRGCEPGASEQPELLLRYMESCAPQWSYPADAGAGDRFVRLRVSFLRH